MYRAIRNINKEIKTTALRLNINRDNYTLDDIYSILLDNDLLNSLERIFNNYKSVNEQSLNICKECLNEKEFIVMMNILRLKGADKSQE